MAKLAEALKLSEASKLSQALLSEALTRPGGRSERIKQELEAVAAADGR